MSREIKFRAWDGAAMVHPAYVDKHGQWYRSDAAIEACEVEQARLLMQFTGLLDCNYKEIYEGDILKGEYPNIGKVEFGEHHTSTDYYACLAYGWFLKAPNGNTYSLAGRENFVIAGNIYQNPELLK